MLNKLQGLTLALSLLLLTSCQSSSLTKSTRSAPTALANPNPSQPAAEQDASWYLQKIKEAKAGENNAEELLSLYDQLIPQLVKIGKGKEALEYANLSVAMAERHYGPDNVHVIKQVVILQKVAALIPDRKLVAQCIDKTIQLQAKASGPDSLPVMWLLDNYARSKSQSCGDEIDPEKLRWLLRLREKFTTEDDVETIRDKSILANCLFHKGEFKESYKIYEECIASCRKRKPGLLSEILLGYSRALVKGGKRAKAIPLLQEAFEISGPEQPKYSSVLAPEIAHELGSALADQKRGGEAKKVYLKMAAQLKREGNPKADFFREQANSVSS